MRLVNFSATNYRSITAAHKITFSNVTTLIGRNNEGKSNLLRALETAMLLLQQHASNLGSWRKTILTNEHTYIWPRDFPIQLQSRRSSKQTILKLEFFLDDDERLEFKQVIGSNLNGSLPLEIKIGRDQAPLIRLVKSGKGMKALTSKSSEIAKFVADRIHFNYIPAIRTDSTTIRLIENLLSQELRTLEKDQRYQDALSTISELQKPVLEELSMRVQAPLKEFLPSIESVRLEISDSSRRYSLRSDVNVFIDDGTLTLLEHKGDGVKSLAALGLLKNQRTQGGASILAIEEPESHLHPAAIHQVRDIINSISETTQVIITTHNPLFVDRENVKSNVIVTDGAATPAKNISTIRELLGIKASDNLTNANYALVVEGNEDLISMKSLLPQLSEKIAKSLKNHSLIIEPIGGAGNLSYKLSLLRNSLCAVHVLLDGDDAGKEAYLKAEKDGLLTLANCTFINCNGMKEAEFEDCLNLDLYKQVILNQQGVDLSSAKFRSNKKWSQRMRDVFLDQGKPFTDKILSQSKYIVSTSVSDTPKTALNAHKRNSIDALVTALERLIKI
ncbi:ATP-dependent nuclease [Pseudomonas sp. LF19]|uniref:ATP-dependent nuclease n=1 Tax=Pseudomonas sp. LF19 TaxID=2899115 RepID=UPI001F2A735F|nr:ATP-binding protein [Pseudomonas sp. LF19]MCE5984849.1 AAA family ATPase [Pseudomonas sp. LF19]